MASRFRLGWPIAALLERCRRLPAIDIDSRTRDFSSIHEMSGPLAAIANSVITIIVVLSIGLPLAACQSNSDFGPISPHAEPVTPYTITSSLQAGDAVKVVVYGQDSLSGVYEISPDGMITMPLIGALRAAGLDRKRLEIALARAYEKFLRDPRVTIADVGYTPIYVLGEVRSPGKYGYTIGLDALTAITTAGGFTYRASTDAILVRHVGDGYWQQYSLTTPLPILPGDLIRVRERYF